MPVDEKSGPEREEKRVLIVDDDDAIRALLFTVLRRRGFDVDTARNGLEALQRCEACRYSLILLDLMMPRMSGWEFLENLDRKRAEQKPMVIVLTAGLEPTDLSPETVVGTVRKPFDVTMLLEMVDACLRTATAVRQVATCPLSESRTLKSIPRRTSDPS
jgi:DNA-binding response OmpR family regulator